MRERIEAIGRGLASLLFPTCCPRCGGRVERAPLPCSACDRELRTLWEAAERMVPVPGLLAAFRLEGAAQDLVHRMKYEADRSAAALLGAMMAGRLLQARADLREGLLVPIPLHPVRHRERGFNQAERLAQALARASGLPVCADLLERTRWSGSQTGRLGRARREAVAGAFGLRRPLPRLPILLVDDVWTTGATAEACRDTLREGGALELIRVLVAARTPVRLPD